MGIKFSKWTISWVVIVIAAVLISVAFFYLLGRNNSLPTGAGAFCGGIAGKQCPNGYTCKYEGNYPDAGGTCVKDAVVCAQVITPARNPATGEVRDFPTPCDVPKGWEPIR